MRSREDKGIIISEQVPEWIAPAYYPNLMGAILPLNGFLNVKVNDIRPLFTSSDFVAINALATLAAGVFSGSENTEILMNHDELIAANSGAERKTARITTISAQKINAKLFEALASAISEVQDVPESYAKGKEIFFKDEQMKVPFRQPELDSHRIALEKWQIVNPESNDIYDLIDTLLMVKTDLGSKEMLFTNGGLRLIFSLEANRNPVYVKWSALAPRLGIPYRRLVENLYLIN